MNKASADKSRKDRLLDAGVFAPIGFVLTRGKAVDDLAAAGRKQVAFTRSLGQAVIKGLTSSTKPKPSPATVRDTTALDATALDATALDATALDVTALDGYDELTAREIVALVAQSDIERVRWIRDTEAAGKQRVTVLRAAERVLPDAP